MARLIRLDSGDWIDPSAVKGIHVVSEKSRAAEDKCLRIRIAIHGLGGVFLLDEYYATFEGAQEVCDALAAVVNVSDDTGDDEAP